MTELAALLNDYKSLVWQAQNTQQRREDAVTEYLMNGLGEFFRSFPMVETVAWDQFWNPNDTLHGGDGVPTFNANVSEPVVNGVESEFDWSETEHMAWHALVGFLGTIEQDDYRTLFGPKHVTITRDEVGPKVTLSEPLWEPE
jgi:hypothetical protein